MAKIDQNENSPQGLLGLAKGRNRLTYINLLKEQKVIQKALVGINFEDPNESTSRSQISFGEIIFDEIEGGEKGANYYSNLGKDNWGLLIDDFLYDDNDMTNGQKAKIALIDSGNISIQLPQFVWDNVFISIR